MIMTVIMSTIMMMNKFEYISDSDDSVDELN